MIPNASERNRGSLGWPLAQGFVAAGGNQNRQLFKGTAGSAALVLLLAPALSLRAANQSEQPSPGLEEKGAELSSKRLELRGMENTLELSEEQRRKIQAEIATIRADRAKLVAALLDATKTVSETESQISETEARLDTLTSSANAIKRSLEARRAVIAEILAALQRMGRRPPPALLASPEDMLSAFRASMLLGSVLPDMRGEMEALAADLSDLVRLRQSVAAERESLAASVAKLNADRERVAALVDARQAALSAAEQALDAERERASALAKQAASLKELIARMETEIAAAKRAAEAARKADESRKEAAEAAPPGTKAAVSPFKDPARLAPALSFADAKGLLPLPVNGTLLRGFGNQDRFGAAEKGILIAARSGAIVSSPCDGWVSFAGPYRSYGQLLIINAGQGYYIILAGMDKINVNVGQFILAGEPVAVMGDGAVRTAAAIAIGAAEPILYVEFRKDGAAIDPGPWWAKPALEKVRG